MQLFKLCFIKWKYNLDFFFISCLNKTICDFCLMPHISFAGLVNVRSKKITYATVGDNITIICPIDEVFSWTSLETKEILAFCNGQNIINKNSRMAQRLHVSSICQLTISRFSKEDVGEYKCSHPTKIFNGKKSTYIDIQLQSK